MHELLNTFSVNFSDFTQAPNFTTFNSHYFGLIALGLAVVIQVALGLYFHKKSARVKR